MTCAGVESRGAELGHCLLLQLGFRSGDGVGLGRKHQENICWNRFRWLFHQLTLNSTLCLSFPTGIMTAIIFISTWAGVEAMVRRPVAPSSLPSRELPPLVRSLILCTPVPVSEMGQCVLVSGCSVLQKSTRSIGCI